ncbi:MAG: alkaline phosphatase [Gammaproteobacteria bacterium]|nr:MAG: alkaline phosphatase [Gammaproteobacteria bacterium]UTW43061.1 oligopeptide:H+ symporter [bacterium SCSIO 12844]
MDQTTTYKHPKAFYAIFMLEIWERFGYMAVMAILALFFTKSLGISQSNSFILFGAYTALIYTFIAIGGYVGDSVIGAKRTIVLGLLFLLCGYILLGTGEKALIYYGLSFVCVGTGFFKSNPSSLLSKCYDRSNPELLHNAFTLFYMAINIGAFLGIFFSPIIAAHYGFRASFIASALGMILALSTFIYSRKFLSHIGTEAGKKSLSYSKLVITIIGGIIAVFIVTFLLENVILAEAVLIIMFLCVIGWYLSISFFKASGKEKSRMMLALILMSEAIIFQILYEQMQTSINFFAINNVEHSLLSFSVEAQSFQALNPFWIILLSPILSYFYIWLKKKNISYNIYNKFASGMLLCGLAFIVLYISKFVSSDQGIVSSWWLVLSYFLQSTGELMISALGVAMVAELVPAIISGFTMGMWFVFLSVGNLLGGYVASTMGLPKGNVSSNYSLGVYTSAFFYIGIIAVIVSGIMFYTSKYKKRMI